MKKTDTSDQATIPNRQRIKEEGIVILDGINGTLCGEDSFFAPDYVICITHKGQTDIMYSDLRVHTEQYTIGVYYPNHYFREISKTDDNLNTLIIVNEETLDDNFLQIIQQLRYRYEQQPTVRLSKHEYKVIVNIVSGMIETSSIDIIDKHKLMVRQLEFLLRILSYYRRRKFNENNTDKRVSTNFYNNLTEHFREHKDVDFYAELASLTSKHFSKVIKQETGQSAAYWIHSHVVKEAKMLLHIRPDLSVQAVANMLGFDEQAAFSRYFRRETGISPTEFREKDY